MLDAGAGASALPSFGLGEPSPHVELVQRCSLNIDCILVWLRMGAMGVAQPASISPITSPQCLAGGSGGQKESWLPDPTFHPLILSFFPSPTDQGCSAQPRTMGRKKIQISRILDQRNRQVSSLGGKAFMAGDTAWAKAWQFGGIVGE